MMTNQRRISSVLLRCSSSSAYSWVVVAIIFVVCFITQQHEVNGFSTPTNIISSSNNNNNNNINKYITSTLSSTTTQLNSLGNNNDEENEIDDDDDEDEDDIIDETNLGDWRKFRASLIDSGLPDESSSSSSSSSTNESNQQQSTTKQQQQPKSTTKSKKSVAIQNEELLEKQNMELAKEYRTGVWAHTINQVEIGGLLCRMPIEYEVYQSEGGYWKEKLDIMIDLDDDSNNDDSKFEEKVDDEDVDELNIAKINQWFQMADRMITRELQSITTSGKVKNGILDPNDLDVNERYLMDKYLDYKSTWQEICLVLSDNPATGCSEAVIINRPITKSINKELGKMMLEGSSGSGRGNFEYGFVDKLVQAFGTEAGVYMGGPDMQEEPALLVHGISDIPGAIEVSPGTGLYRGGLEGAVNGILDGKYKPLDFRFFIGRQSYDPTRNPQRGVLSQKIQDGKYQPVACARSVALKQCLGLPKPLWHEVLELCGGEMKSLSSIELKKRVDLQQ